METVAIKGAKREGLGKKATKAVRKAGLVPCVIYGGDEPLHFTARELAFRSIVYTPEFKLADIEVDGANYKCILKDLQFHPVTDRIQHIDFLRLIEGTPIKVELPIRFKGIAPGVKLGGKLLQKMRRATVKLLPENLFDALFVDVSSLELGDTVRVRDIEQVENAEIMHQGAIPVASVEIPRALRSATAAAETAGGEAAAEEE